MVSVFFGVPFVLLVGSPPSDSRVVNTMRRRYFIFSAQQYIRAELHANGLIVNQCWRSYRETIREWFTLFYKLAFNRGLIYASQMRVYVDYQAATPVLPEVLEAMRPFFGERFGNPSSLHQEGHVTKEALARAREQVACFLNAEAAENIIFTGNGTEAVN